MIRNILLLPILFLAIVAQAQYSEPFSVANKGYKINCVDDLTTVNWTLTPWDPTGSCRNNPPDPVTDLRDPADYFNTTAGGVLESIDTDEEVCWESPLINTVAANPVSIKMDLTWAGFDTDIAANNCSGDYIKVLYSVNGGAYVMIPNVKGGNACATVAYPFGAPGAPFTDNVMINHGGIAGGSTLKIRVCISTNANAEIVTIDNVAVPEAGVFVGCASPVLSTVITQVGCSNPNSGAIDLTVSAGTPPYTYSWTGGATTQDLTNKPAGTYTVTVTDAASCTATISATITAAPAITLTTQVLDASCNGNMDGEISLDVTGGVPGYTYDWSNDGPENPDNDPQDLVGLGTGTFTVTVTDASGCTKTTSATVGVLPSGAYLEQFNIANKGYLANWVDDFSGVNWTMSGWTKEPPAAFGRDMADFFRTNGGVLYGEDFDQDICWESPLIDLNGGTQFSVDLAWSGFDNQTDEYINVKYSIDGGGYVTIPNVVGGGTGTIQYNSGLDHSGSQTVTKTGLSGGTIQIQVCAQFNSNNENMTIDNVNIPGSNNYCPAPEPSLTGTNVSCNGGANGTITTTVSNGTAPYTYAWSDGGVTTQNRTGLVAGTYTVTVTDANMATGTASIQITQPSAIVLTETHVNVLCNGAATGSIDLTVSGGTPAYTYSWTGGATTQDRSGLTAGTYTVTVIDSKGCTKTLSATITQPTAIVLTETHVNALCNGQSNGSIDLTVTGGTGAYTYSWTGGATTQDRFALLSGTYTVTVTDANACTKTLSVTITQPNTISVSSVDINVPCRGDATGGFNITVSGGTPGYTYDWSNNGAQNPDTDPEDLMNVVAGTYTVTITDANGCLGFFGDTVKQPATLLALSTTQVNVSCQGGSTGSIDLTVTGGGSPYTYSWTGGATTQDRSGLAAGTYTVTVTDANNCVKTISATITEPATGIALSATLTQPTNCFVANGTIDLSVSGGTPGFSYDWSNDGAENPDNDPQDLLNLVEGTYTVTVTDANGCSKTSSFTLDYIDIIPPTITCPANATVNANASCQGQIGSYTAASVSDNCNLSPTVTQSPAPSTLLTGHNATQTVTLTANDGSGNTATCTLTVTLKDVTPPTVTCQGNVTINANASCQGALGLYSLSGTDNCSPSLGYTQSPSNGTIISGHNTVQVVTLTAGDDAGNTASCTLTVTLKDVTPPSITCPANATVNANASCQGQVGSYNASSLSDNCNPSPTVTQSPVSSTQLTGHNAAQTVTLTANDGNGNTSTCTLTVTLKDVTPPTVTCQGNVTINANASCQGALGLYSLSGTDNCSPSLGYTQSPSNGTIISGHNTVQVVTLTAGDDAGNPASCTLTVTLKDVTPPSITCPANATVNANASCQGQVGSYNASSLSDNCNPSPTVTQSPVSSTLLTGHNATQTVTLTANDGNGNTATCTLTVTLKDVTPPSLTCPANATVAANASCQATVGTRTPASLSDNCNPSPTITQSPAATTTLTGHNTSQVVTLTVNDGNGNTSTCSMTVTVKDVTPPTVTCQSNVTINANASCQGALGLYSLSGTDNCSPSLGYTQSPSNGTIISGHNTVQVVTLTAGDDAGNPASCTLTVTLKDVTPPSITCPANATVNANASCQGTVGAYSPASLSDNCNPASSVTQSPVSSTLLTGHNATQTVTLTANDGNGNTSFCTMTVTLKDVTPPTITCPANTTVAANASCQGTIGSYSAATLSDNCNPASSVTQSPASSTVLTGHNAAQTVTLTANDGNGNTSTCTLVVTLKDVTPPTITCPANTTVNANASCQGQVGSYSAATLSDNCNPSPTVTQSPAASTLMTGHNATQTVTLTANDGNGNTATCTLTVTLKDVTPPTITCPANTTVAANASCQVAIGSYSPASLSDNCNPTPTVAQSPVAGSTISGHNTVQTVTLTATDVAGNTQTCTLTVTLKDVTPPSIICKAYVAILDASGNVSITPANVYQSGSDNCGVVNLVSVVASSFNCSNVGNNLVTLTANDGNGNTATCSATVTVRDVTPPVAKCQNVTANLGANGTVTVPPAAVNNGSTDNCSITFMLTPNTFNCSQIGMQTVTLTATDPGGNMSTCTAKVTVRDITGPIAKCKNPTIYLDDTGNATLSAAQVNNGSTDNCGIATMSIDWTSYDCSDIGGTPSPVNLSMTDVNGNSSTCLAYVTVKDAIAPTAICEDVTVVLGDNGYVVVYGADLAFNSTDNCSVWSYLPYAKVYTAANLGPNNLTVTVKDWSGNASTCVSVVTVILPGNSDFQQGGAGKGGTSELFDFVVYPNPTGGDATMAFQLPGEQAFVCRMYDSSGRMIFSHEDIGVKGESNIPLRLEGLAPGIYLIDFQSESWKVQKRLVLQR